MNNKIILGYDVMTYNGEQPNCLNPKFLNTIYNASDFYFSNSLEFFSKRWNTNWVLYNSNMYNNFAEKKSIYNIIEDRKAGINYNWFYIVEPFANLENFFGNDKFYNEFCLKNISKTALNEIINGNGKLLINYVIDGGTAFQIKNFEKIIKFTKDNNIPDEKVYFVFADFKLGNNLKKLGVNYKVIDYSYNMIGKGQEFYNTINNPNYSYWGEGSFEPQFGTIEHRKNSVTTSTEFLESIGNEKKDFLLLNRHWKLHRLLLLSQLHKLGFEKSLVSWDKQFSYQLNRDSFLMHDNNEEFLKLITETSALLDIQDLTKIAGFGFENKDIYLNTYLSIVTESVYFQEHEDFPSGYLSEKIWKPIGHCQPFILAGPSKSLEHIRERFGYKTFHPYIDESYDMENDDFKRLKMIQIEIEKFASKTKEEKDDFLNNVKDVCVYNQNLFLQYAKNSWNYINHNKEMQLILNFLLDGQLEFTKSII
jgi:TM2 domain-containing membrane protein YozV